MPSNGAREFSIKLQRDIFTEAIFTSQACLSRDNKVQWRSRRWLLLCYDCYTSRDLSRDYYIALLELLHARTGSSGIPQ